MSAILLAALLFPSIAADDYATQWGVVIDCGSSGTRVHLYFWPTGNSTGNIQEFTPPAEISVRPGISSFARDPSAVAAYFSPLLEQAAQFVPSSKQAATQVRALATGGMRMLDAAEQAPLWANITAVIRASPFAFTDGDAQTIAGEYEGIFNFLALQHILGADPSLSSSVGGLDLGGASTQITFAPVSGVILNEAYRLRLSPTHVGRLYSHSYMLSGQDEAIRRYAQRLSDAVGGDGSHIASPCYNVGYNASFTLICAGDWCERTLVGTGNYTACRQRTEALLNLGNECLLRPCAAQGVYSPPTTGKRFYAVSAYYYTAHGLGLLGWNDERALSTAQIEAAGAAFCARAWADAAVDAFAMNYCFASAYMSAMLDAYGIDRESTSAVTYARKVGGFSLSWTLGAQIYFAEQRYSIQAEDTISSGSSGTCMPTEQSMVAMALGLVAALCAGALIGAVCLPRCMTCCAERVEARAKTAAAGSAGYQPEGL